MNPSMNMNNVSGYNPLMAYGGGQQKFPPIEDLKACRISKRKWTINEDIRLHELVQYYGTNEWVLIANMMHNRNSRQCRERWRTKFNPEILKGDWSTEEDSIILTMYADIGSKWVSIAKALSGRTESDVRNRYLSLCRAKTKGFDDVTERARLLASVEKNKDDKEAEVDEDGNKKEVDKEKTDLKSTIASLLEQIDKNNKRKIDANTSTTKKSKRNAPDIRTMYMSGLVQQQAQQQSMIPYQYPPSSNQAGYAYPNIYPPSASATAPPMPATADGMVPASAYMQLMQQTQMQQQLIEQMQQQNPASASSASSSASASKMYK